MGSQLQRLVVLLILWLSCWLCLPRQVSSAQDKPLDVVIVIDQSGSMADSDPLKLRWDAAAMLVGLLSDRDRVGVVSFSSTAETLFPELILLDEQRRINFRDDIDKARISLGSSTAYLKAIDATRRLLENPTGNQRVVIFLTDGIPTDATPDMVKSRLEWFRSQRIPVYFFLLTGPKELSRAKNIAQAFETTGPMLTWIKQPTDIARAFAKVLTDLQPGTYLDSLGPPLQDQVNTHRFSAQATVEHHLAKATFIFVSSQVGGRFSVKTILQPENTTMTSFSGSNYSVITAVSSNQQPINGSWSFVTNAADTVAFAFLQSDLQLDLVYPGIAKATSQRGAIGGTPLLIGASPLGLAKGQGANLQATLIPGGCNAEVADKSTVYTVHSLDSDGLSDNDSVYWTSVGEWPTGDQNLGIKLQMGQLDKPLRLVRCFDVRVLKETTDGVTFVKPAVGEKLVDGAIPVEVRLNPDIEWSSVTVYSQDPDNVVTTVSLPIGDPKGEVKPIQMPGRHIIRVVAVGQYSGIALASYRETSYVVENDLHLEHSQYELGMINALDQVLSEVVTITGAFIRKNTRLEIGTITTKNQDTGNAVQQSLVKVVPCQDLDIQDRRATCNVQIYPAPSLPAGSYVVEIPVRQRDPDKDVGIASLKFVRPQSEVSLVTDVPLELGLLEVNNTFLTASLRFESNLWQGDPQFPSKPDVITLRNLTDMIDLETSGVDAEMDIHPGADELDYDLVVRPASTLQPGKKYLAEVALESASSDLKVAPSKIPVKFEIPSPGVYLSFTQLREVQSIWGNFLFIPGLKREFYLPVIADTVHMTGAPKLDLPEVFRVATRDGKIDFSASSIVPVRWRDDGMVEGKPDQHRFTLVMQIVEPLPEGDKLIRMRMPDSIKEPHEYETPVAVLGRTYAWWATGCPLVGVLMLGALMVRVRAVRRRAFTGTLTNANVPKLELNLAKYKQYPSIEPTIDNQGRWGAKPSTDPRKVLIRCVSSSTIEIAYSKRKVTLHKGTTNGPWTYR